MKTDKKEHKNSSMSLWINLTRHPEFPDQMSPLFSVITGVLIGIWMLVEIFIPGFAILAGGK
jgi:hypothetical protein